MATGGLPGAIGRGERAAGKDRDAERAEVIGGNVVSADARGRRGIDRTAGQEQDRSRTAAERRAPIDRGRFDAGHGLDAREQSVDGGRTRCDRISGARRPHPEGQHVFGHETGSAVLDAREVLDQQPDAVSSRHAIATSVTTRIESAWPRPAAAAIVFLERRRQLETRRRERRHERGQKRRAQGHGEGEHQHDGIERRRAEAADGEVVVPATRDHRRRCAREDVDAPPGQKGAAHARDRRHHQPLGEQLLHQAAPARTDGQPDRDLRVAARARARGAGWPR